MVVNLAQEVLIHHSISKILEKFIGLMMAILYHAIARVPRKKIWEPLPGSTQWPKIFWYKGVNGGQN